MEQEISKYQDIIWLKDTIEELIFKIKILENDKYRYEIVEHSEKKILFFPIIPRSIIRRFQTLSIKFKANRSEERIILNQLDDQRGYELDTRINFSNFGVCEIISPEFHEKMREYLDKRKYYIKQIIGYFVNSFKKTIMKWKLNVLRGQRNFIGNLDDEFLKLKIIEGQAGTGKTEYIIRQVPKFNGRVGIIVYGDGAIETYLERIGDDLNSLYVFSNQKFSKTYHQRIVEAIELSKIDEDEHINLIQDEWIELLSSFKDMSSFFSMFSPAVLIKERDVSKFLMIVKPTKLFSVYVDDGNQFHPWSLLEILPLSDNITITGDNTQLKAIKDFEFVVKRLGFSENSVSINLPSETEFVGIPRIQMNLDEELTLSTFMSGNLRRLSKSIQSGLSFPKLKLFENLDGDLIERIREISNLRDRSLLTVVKSWPVEGIVSQKLTELYRYIGNYKSLLIKLRIIEGSTYRSITEHDKHTICDEIYSPITFYDFPVDNSEEKRYWDKSVFNNAEVDKIKEIIKKIVSNSKKSILVVSGYGAQTSKLQQELQNTVSSCDNVITISHVDSTSSLERDIIIISLTRNNSSKTIGHLENNRISMMLKRGREYVIVVGSSNTFVYPTRENKLSSNERRIVKGLRDEAQNLGTYHNVIGGGGIDE